MNSHPAEELSAYISGELDSAERIRIEEHLSGCGSCREELIRLGKLNEVLSKSATLEPSSGFVAGVMRRLDVERPVIVFRKRRILAWAAVAAAIAFLVISLSLQNEIHPPSGVTHTVIKPPASAVQPQTGTMPGTQLSEQDADLIAELDLLESMDVIQDLDSLENMEFAMLDNSEEIAQ